jgi:hypothetical protein
MASDESMSIRANASDKRARLQTSQNRFASVDGVARGVVFDAKRATMAAML